ncbi:MAG: ISAs1 family transposase [Pirellulaceae bacterium]|nr:ISAs1 family transposase [Pirellulaceae bacterium]
MASSFVSKTYNHFENVTDPRVNRGNNYPLIEMIFVTLCACISDADGWADVERYGKAKLAWLRKYFPFDNGIPSHDTFGLVFSRLDTVEFYASLQNWANDISQSLDGQTVAFDGKTLRGSHDKYRGKSALHSVSAWVCGLRMCIGLKSVDDKSNEIPAVQELIDVIDLKGAVVTADAMHCQTETAKAIIDKEADYILMVKGNQPTLQDALHDAIINAMENDDPKVRRSFNKEINRGRVETREVIVQPIPKDSAAFANWAGIKSIGAIHRTREVNGKLEESTETFISSREPKVRDIARRIREHWSVENQQHYILDVTFSEDASRIRNGNSPEISSVFRRLALNILQRDTTIKDSIRGKRKRCAWDNSAIEKLIANFSSN